MEKISDKKVEKKKPGRPRKNPIKKPMKRNGISNKPMNNENYIEMIYDKPSVFKKLFYLFKSMAVNDICIEFNKEYIYIITADHLKKSHIRVKIFSNRINHYYCEESHKIYLNPRNMEKIIQTLDKNYISIAFIIKKKSTRSILNILCKNEINIDDYREIDILEPNESLEDVKYDIVNYPIKFTLPGKYFKKLISDMGSFSDIWSITKYGKNHLTFKYISRDKTVKTRHIVKSPKDIKLISTIADDDIFSSSVRIDYIKPISNSLISEEINIAVDNKKNMIINIEIDKQNNKPSILVSVNTDIIRFD